VETPPLPNDSPDGLDLVPTTSIRSHSKPDGLSGMTLGQARAKYKMKCPVLKIHGCVHHPDSIVLSRNAYKRLKHETPGYKMFLTTAMATSTMLYIGFSFTDDYLNDFRAEVLSMLRPRRSLQSGKESRCNFSHRTAHQGQELKPIGYGIIEGRLKHECKFFRFCLQFLHSQQHQLPPLLVNWSACAYTHFTRRHEGVEIMTWNPNYCAPDEAQSAEKWHNGLDVYLQCIFRKTHANYINGQMLTENFFSSRRFHVIFVSLFWMFGISFCVTLFCRKIITWDVGEEKKTANFYLRQCLNHFNSMIRSQENSGFREVSPRISLHLSV
jgi:hypothetical protein